MQSRLLCRIVKLTSVRILHPSCVFETEPPISTALIPISPLFFLNRPLLHVATQWRYHDLSLLELSV